MEEPILLVATAAFGGGLLSAVLGWVDSSEPFNLRKFAKSLLAALFGALVFSTTYTFTGGEIGLKDVFLAVLGGAGIDALANRAGLSRL